MPFDNPLFGGDDLVRPQLQSPNYSAGVSGWIIRKDGTVEFNSGVFRSSLQVGPSPGAHILIDAVTDTILVYDAGNNLIASISPTSQTIGGVAVGAGIESYSSTTPLIHTRIVNGEITMVDNNIAPLAAPGYIINQNQSVTGQIAQLLISSGSINAVTNDEAQIQLVSKTGNAAFSSWIQLIQQAAGPGARTSGQAVQTAGSAGSEPFMLHIAVFSLTTNASGQATFAHGCNFTPNQALFGGGGNNTIGIMAWGKSYTATNATIQVNTASGTPFVGNVQIVAAFFGK